MAPMRVLVLLIALACVAFASKGCRKPPPQGGANNPPPSDTSEEYDIEQTPAPAPASELEQDIECLEGAVRTDSEAAGSSPQALTQPEETSDSANELPDLSPAEASQGQERIGERAQEGGEPVAKVRARFDSSGAAHEFASQKQKRARQQAEDGKLREAYSGTVEAWQALQPHLDDNRAKRLSESLLMELRQYGERLNSIGVPIRGKPLKIK